MAEEETNTQALARLRERIERNLSGLLGPHFARDVVETRLPIDRDHKLPVAERMRFMEERLEASRSHLRGLAAQLDTMRRYHRQVLEDLPVGVCSIASTGSITTWNGVMSTLSGVDKSKALDSQVDQLPVPWGELLKQFLDSDQREIHKKLVHLEGRPRWFGLLKATPGNAATTNDTGSSAAEPLGTSILLQDLTNVHLLEDQLAHNERLASIGRFASGVAHEIGNPVTGIACLAQNLKEEIRDSEMREEVQGILQQTERINNIVQTLVNFSRRGDADKLEKHRFDLRGCLEEATELVRLSQPNKNIDVLIDCDPQLNIEGDRQRLCQVFVNILTNSYDASPAGSSVRVLASKSAELIQVSLRDHGHGMPDELSARIFEPFVTTKQPGDGTGLGMALTYGIVRDHGGEIEVDSAPGVGTEVRVVLQGAP